MLRDMRKTVLLHVYHFTTSQLPQWGCAFLLGKEWGVCLKEHLIRQIILFFYFLFLTSLTFNLSVFYPLESESIVGGSQTKGV